MGQERDTHGFVVLDRAACLDRLATRHLASVAVTSGALPLVLPVHYSLFGEHILMGADPTGVLGRRLPNHVISLCVHDIDDDLLSGWSVTVTGLAEPVAPRRSAAGCGRAATMGDGRGRTGGGAGADRPGVRQGDRLLKLWR